MAQKKHGKRKLPAFQTTKQLKSRKGMAAYLAASLNEGDDDPTVIAEALGTIAKVYGMGKLAQETGLTRGGLYKALSADTNPSLGTVLRVMKALGMKLTPQVV